MIGIWGDRAVAHLLLFLLLLGACGDAESRIEGRLLALINPPGPDSESCAQPTANPRYRPLPHATVSSSRAVPSVTTTDEHGLFFLEGVEETGRHLVSAFAAETVEGRQIVEVAIDEPGQGAEVELLFTAAGVIGGVVEPPADHPLAADRTGFVVSLACPPRTTVTDAQGRFGFAEVPVGVRHLTATAPEMVTPETVEVVVSQGRSTEVTLYLEQGRPPDLPANRPPEIDPVIAVVAGDRPAGGRIAVRPPVDGWVRGDHLRFTCNATDPDGDGLRWIWNASSGELDSWGADTATFVAAGEDAGVSCTAIDGHGGQATAHRVLPVFDPYYAGATVVDGGVVFSVAFSDGFDLAFDGAAASSRLALPGNQWLPRGAGNLIAFAEQSATGALLVSVRLDPNSGLFSSNRQLADGVRDFAVAGGGVAWVDQNGNGWFSSEGGTPTPLGANLTAPVAGSVGDLAFGQSDGNVRLFRIGAGGPLLPGESIATPGRSGAALAVSLGRIGYWAGGEPMVAGATGLTLLAPRVATESGRIVLNGPYAAFSQYRSPVQFVEATAVRLEGGRVVASQRVAIGPSETLDLEGTRLLLGRPRSIESEPSAEIWVVDLVELGVVP